MKKIPVILGVIVLSLSAANALADGIGLTVAGSLTLLPSGTINYLDSANGAVPPGYGNSGATGGTAVIGSGVEFGVTNGADLFTVDYTGTTVTITDTCVAVSGCGTTPFFVELFSPFITGYTIDSYNFPNSTADFGFSSTFGGDAGQFTYLGGLGFTGGTATFDYTVAAPAVPEPATLGLMATGLIGVAGAIRRRFRAQA